MKKLALAAALVAAGPAPASAETWSLHDAIAAPDPLTITGSARIRGEVLDGQYRPGLDGSDSLVTTRIAIAAEYEAGPVRIGAEFVDSRAFGGDAGSAVGTGEVNALELVQAYVGLDLSGSDGRHFASLDLGRMTLDLGSRRLVGRNNFRNTTNAFTGARLSVHPAGKVRGDFFWLLPHQRLPDDKEAILDNEVEWDRESSEVVLRGGFLSAPAPARAALELYFLALDEEDGRTRATRDRHLRTSGLRFHRDPSTGRWDWELEAALQSGSIRASTAMDATELDVLAWTLHAEIGRQLKGAWQPRLSLEWDVASGDRASAGQTGRTYERFDSLFGPRRPDWGPTGIYGPLGRANIRSAGARVEVKPNARWDAIAAWRTAWLDSANDSFAFTGVRDPAGASGRFAGNQIEARARYWLVPAQIRIEAGGAALLKGRFLREAPNANRDRDTIYGYADITFSF